MKKFSTILVLLLLCLTGAKATVSFDEDKVYSIKCARGALCVTSADATTLSCTTTADSTDTLQQFKFIQSNGYWYIYSVGAKKFLDCATPSNKQVALSSDEGLPVTITEDGDYYHFSINNNWFNIDGHNAFVCNDWRTVDNGNNFTVAEVTDATVPTTSSDALKLSYIRYLKIGDETVFTDYAAAAYNGTASASDDWTNDYVTITAPDDATVTSNLQEFTFTGTVSWPFPYNTWCAMTLRGKYLVYDSSATTETGYPFKTVVNLSPAGLWRLTGTPYAITIENAAASDQVLLASDQVLLASDRPLFGDASSSTSHTWLLGKNTYDNNENYFWLYNSNVGYLNDLSNKNYLGGWQSTSAKSDYGSAIQLIELSNLVTASTDAKWGELCYTGSLDDYLSDPTEDNYTALNVGYKGSDGYVNLGFSGFSGVSIGLKSDDSGYVHGQTTDLNDITQLWQVLSVSEDSVRLYHPATGKYLQDAPTGGSNTTALGDDPYDYVISWNDDGTFTLRGSTYKNDETLSYLRYESGDGNVGNINKWSDNDTLTYTTVASISNTLHTVGDYSYSTLYMPCQVTVPNDVTAYTATLNGESFTLTSIGQTIPAKTPVVLMASSSTTSCDVTLSTVTTEGTSKGDLSGTLVPMTWSSNYYTLGQINNVPGFYKWDGTTLSAGKAYYDGSDSSSAKGFTFGGAVTGIDTLENSANVPADAARYNLAGQRVSDSYQGVVIMNGKKFIQK